MHRIVLFFNINIYIFLLNLETGMEKRNVIARRTFFSGLGVAAVGAAILKFTRTLPTPHVADPAPEAPSGDGYRMTEHIKKYYRSTTI